MPFEVVWANDEKTIIHEIYQGVITPDEYLLASNETNALLTSVTHTVDVIADGRQITLLRGNFLVTVQKVSSKTPKNQGAIVVVKPDRMIEIFVSIITRLFPNLEIHTTKTVEEAFAFITAKNQERATDIL